MFGVALGGFTHDLIIYAVAQNDDWTYTMAGCIIYIVLLRIDDFSMIHSFAVVHCNHNFALQLPQEMESVFNGHSHTRHFKPTQNIM